MMENPVALYYEEHGKGLPVVLIHGFPLDHTTWNPVVPLLRDHARLILPDLRGFGKSPQTDDAVLSMRLHGEDILRLLDRLEIEQAVLVGHSMGGYISLAFAHDYPGRIAGLGLVGTQAAADSGERRQVRMKMAGEIKRRGLARATAGLAEKYVADPALVPQMHELILKSSPRTVIAALKGLAERPDSTENLADMNIPALVIAGEKDALIPMELSRTMNQLLPWSWMVEIPGCGHSPMMEAPVQVADALHKFFHAIEGKKKA